MCTSENFLIKIHVSDEIGYKKVSLSYITEETRFVTSNKYNEFYRQQGPIKEEHRKEIDSLRTQFYNYYTHR